MASLVNLLAAFSVTVLAVTLIVTWLLSGLLVRRRPADPKITPDKYGLFYEHVRFSSRDGIELGGWLVGNGLSQLAKPGRSVVIFCPGLFGNLYGDVADVPMFVDVGLDVLQFDWRGHGISDGGRVTFGLQEIDDLLGAIDFLQARGVQRIGLMGFSMGGTVALNTAAQDQRVACVVNDSGYVSFQTALSGYLSSRMALLRPAIPLLITLTLWMVGVRLSRHLGDTSPLPQVSQISPRPVLHIYGAADPLVPVAEQEALLAATGQPTALWRVPGAGHREARPQQPEEYERRVTSFFRMNLNQKGPSV
ncbi:MAG: alpha/beta fold hydrolase [Chloroflexi bacterium]|nr:alpha/beta fold hydrolase [Chloroflexota bacterium]